MKKLKFNYYCCLLIAVISVSKVMFAGTTLIDFNACANSTSCNIFSTFDQGSNTLCNGVKIYSYLGSPVYITQNAKRVVSLQADYAFPSNGGDGFSIEYPFKANHSYTINITTSKGLNANSNNYAQCQLSLETTAAPLSPDHCNIGYAVLSANYLLGASLIANSSAPQTTSYFSHNRASNYSHLRVRSYGSSGFSSITDMSIYKIEIIETKLSFSFPSYYAVICQNPITNTFSVDNPNGIYGNISYSWNIGAGWLYNGNPTPTTVSGSSNTITLSTNADPSNPPKNISVIVYVDGVVYASYLCNILFESPRPGYYINGPGTICTQPTSYTVPGLPSNAYVSSWSKWDDNNLINISSNGNSCTLSKTSAGANGSIVLWATVQTPCGSFFYGLAVDVGKLPAPINIQSTIEDLNHIPLHSYVEISVEPAGVYNGYTYEWFVNAGTIVSGQGTQTIGVFVTGQGGNNFSASVSFVNACGRGAPITLSGTIGNNYFSDPNLFDGSEKENKDLDLTIYPNPASNFINIASAGKGIEKTITVINLLGKVVRNIISTQTNEKIDISDLATGTYLVRITTADKVVTKKITKYD